MRKCRISKEQKLYFASRWLYSHHHNPYTYGRYHRHRCIRQHTRIMRHGPAHSRTRSEVNQGYTEKVNKSEKYPSHRWRRRNHCQYPWDQVTRPQNWVREEGGLKYYVVYIIPIFCFLILKYSMEFFIIFWFHDIIDLIPIIQPIHFSCKLIFLFIIKILITGTIHTWIRSFE